MARVVNLKLVFTDWSFLNLAKLFYFRETRLFFWKTKNFGKLQLPQSLIFFAEILHMFPIYQCLQKDVQDFFYFVKSY